MTDQHSPSPATQPAALDPMTQACVHIDAAAQQLEADAHGDVFSALLGLAGQLALVCGGIDPAVRAAPDPNDRLPPLAHLDRALTLLDAVPASGGPPDLLVWTLRLANLRDALMATGAGQP